jgi:hypothetical protein
LLGFIWWVTPVTNETELSQSVERENVQGILKSTGKDEKRNEGLKKKGKILMKIQVFWKIKAVSSGKY